MAEERSIPTSKNPDLATFTIKIDGSVISGVYQIFSISVGKEVNRIPTAKIIIKDGEASESNFKASSEDLFIPGKEIEILAGYHNDETTIFKGIIIKHSIRIREGSSRLIIDCKDKTYKMSLVKKSRYFEKTSDSDAVESIIGSYGLDKDVASTGYDHVELVQYHATDWDFMISRADANGLITLIDGGKITLKKPQLEGNPVLQLTFGANILELDAEIDGRLQFEGIKAFSWDAANQEILEVEAQEPSLEEQGNLSAVSIASELQMDVLDLKHAGKLQSEELQAWADAKISKNRMAKIRGRVRFQGFGEVNPGNTIQLQGLGDRFNGKAFVNGVLHEIGNGQWMTNVQFGLDDQWFVEKNDISAPSASLLIPAVRGLQIGVVTSLEGDPDGEERIKVKLPLVDSSGEGNWARLATLDAGNGRGTYFRPEIGDEVIVGFINDDPRDAIVLGSLFSSANPSPEALSDDNFKKGFLSKESIKIEVDDDKKTILLQTPGGNKIFLDDAGGGIFIEDQNGNKVEMSSSGILVESAGKIENKAAQDLSVEGVNINIEAKAGATVKGNASAEISSGGATTVKGSLVQIN